MRILAIESSCDETAAAVVENGRRVLSNAVASQIEIHRRFGGVVPEIASRNHTLAIEGVVKRALEEAGCMERSSLPYHRMILEKKLPYTIGGGIGQSRLCMFLLHKAHVGEVQASVWQKEARMEAAAKGFALL